MKNEISQQPLGIFENCKNLDHPQDYLLVKRYLQFAPKNGRPPYRLNMGQSVPIHLADPSETSTFPT